MKSNKGGQFEREICKLLSLWWSDGKRGDIFWRTAGSGARATVRLKKNMKTSHSYGDVGSVHPSGNIFTKTSLVSIKRGYTRGKNRKKNLNQISFLDIIDTPAKRKTKPALIVWWKELKKQVEKSGRKRGFVIFRRDRKESVIVMSKKTYELIRENCFKDKRKPCTSPEVIYKRPCINPVLIQWAGIGFGKKSTIFALKLEDFFCICDPQLFGAPKRIKRNKNRFMPCEVIQQKMFGKKPNLKKLKELSKPVKKLKNKRKEKKKRRLKRRK